MTEATPKPVIPGKMYSGDEANERVRLLAERRRNMAIGGDAITTGIPFVDANNPPLTRGDMSVIVGLTSEGKSMLATTMVKHTVDEIKAGKRNGHGAVIVALTEETIEARRVQLWGDHRVNIRNVLAGSAPMELITQNIAKTTGEPLYFVGDSAGAVDVTEDETFGSLTVQRIVASISVLVKSGIVPELVVIDHAHDLSTERNIANEQETYELVARQLVQCSSWLRQFCPLVVVAQAKKEVMARQAKDRLPTKYDLSYMAAVARRARDIYSIWYPAYHMEDGAKVKAVQGEIHAAKGVFVVSMSKGRYGEITSRPFAMTAYNAQGNWTGMLQEITKQA